MSAQVSYRLRSATTWTVSGTLTFRITFPKNRRLKEPAQRLGPGWTGPESSDLGKKGTWWASCFYLSQHWKKARGSGSDVSEQLSVYRMSTLSRSSTVECVNTDFTARNPSLQDSCTEATVASNLQSSAFYHPTSDFTPTELSNLKLRASPVKLWTRQLFTSLLCEEGQKSPACSACYIFGTFLLLLPLQILFNRLHVCLVMLTYDNKITWGQTWVHGFTTSTCDQNPTKSANSVLWWVVKDLQTFFDTYAENPSKKKTT